MAETPNVVQIDWKRARRSLGNVYWIGGATTAGKSTISKRMADNFEMVLYCFDSRVCKQFHLYR